MKTEGQIGMMEGVYAHYHIKSFIWKVQVLRWHFPKPDPLRHLIEKGILTGNIRGQGGQVDTRDFPGSSQRPYDSALPPAAA